MERRRKEEEERQAVLALEKEKEGLTSCCATLRADLEEKERRANREQEQIAAAQTKVKVPIWGQTDKRTLFPFLMRSLNCLVLSDPSFFSSPHKKGFEST